MRTPTVSFMLSLALGSNGQDTLHFAVSDTRYGPPAEWRDSMYVVAATDPVLIAQAQAELLLPIEERRLVRTSLTWGNDGTNRNGPFAFSWHVPVNGWSFEELTVEIYDGLPYTDVETSPSFWIDTLGVLCSWTSYLRTELEDAPLAIPALGQTRPEVFPNPTSGLLHVSHAAADRPTRVILMDATGRAMLVTEESALLDLTAFAAGTYTLHLQWPDRSRSVRVVKY